jgi:hypothetical protein
MSDPTSKTTICPWCKGGEMVPQLDAGDIPCPVCNGSGVQAQTTDEGPTDGWLLDGQQRVTAILAYICGDFPVFGYRFAEVTLPERRNFMTMPVGALITNITDPEACRHVYQRLAYGGTPHEPKD